MRLKKRLLLHLCYSFCKQPVNWECILSQFASCWLNITFKLKLTDTQPFNHSGVWLVCDLIIASLNAVWVSLISRSESWEGHPCVFNLSSSLRYKKRGPQLLLRFSLAGSVWTHQGRETNRPDDVWAAAMQHQLAAYLHGNHLTSCSSSCCRCWRKTQKWSSTVWPKEKRHRQPRAADGEWRPGSHGACVRVSVRVCFFFALFQKCYCLAIRLFGQMNNVGHWNCDSTCFHAVCVGCL